MNFPEVDLVLGKAGRDAPIPRLIQRLSLCLKLALFSNRNRNGGILTLGILLGARVAASRSMAHHARSQSALLTAVGGENVSSALKAGERCPVNVRYLRDFRLDLESLGRGLAPVTGDKQIPLSEPSTIRTLSGPSMIRNEDGLLTEYVFVDVTDVPVGDAACSMRLGHAR